MKFFICLCELQYSIRFVGSEVLNFDSSECECENVHGVMCNELCGQIFNFMGVG